MKWTPFETLKLAKTKGRHPEQVFGIKATDRLSHMYIVGKTGTGKSTLLGNMIEQDIRAFNGFCLIDPHGDLVERIYQSIPDYRKAQTFYLNVPEVHQVSEVLGYNPLRYVKAELRPLAAAGILDVFKKLWDDSWGVRLEHILRNCLLTLLEVPGANMADILRLLQEKDYRSLIVPQITNPQIKAFWINEYNKYSYPFRQKAIAPIENKVGAFLADPVLRKILTEPDIDLSLRKIMDEGGILLVNLSKGQLGEDTAGLLGALLVTTLNLAAFSRQSLPEDQRRAFYVYMDEFQTFTTLSMAEMTSELRKYGVGLVMAHQYMAQLEPKVRSAILGNSGTIITFRLGGEDAGYMSRELGTKFQLHDIMSLPNYQMYTRLMIDGAPSSGFSAQTLPPANPNNSPQELGTRQ